MASQPDMLNHFIIGKGEKIDVCEGFNLTSSIRPLSKSEETSCPHSFSRSLKEQN